MAKKERKKYYFNAKGLSKEAKESMRQLSSKAREKKDKHEFRAKIGGYKDTGFFSDYPSESEWKSNNFFVFQAGASRQYKANILQADTIKNAMTAAEKAVKQAEQACLATENGFINDFFSSFDQNSEGSEYVQGALSRAGVSDFWGQKSFTSEEVQDFFNTSLFNGTSSVVGNINVAGSIYEGVQMTDLELYQVKIRDMAYGLWHSVQNSANNPIFTRADAYNALKTKFEDYIKEEYSGKNVATGLSVGALFGELGYDLPGSQLEEDMLNSFLDEVLMKKPDNITDIGEGIAKGDIAFKSNPLSNEIAGSFNEYVGAIIASKLFGKISSKSGSNLSMSIAQTGKDNWYLSKKYSASGTNSKAGYESKQGRTDFRMTVDFTKQKTSKRYKINVSAKLNQGHSYAKSEEGKKKAFANKFPKIARTIKVYGGGTLYGAFDRIASSSLMSSGIMTSEDFESLVYLILNAGQGGLYEKDKQSIVALYRAVAGFCGIDELSEGIGLEYEDNGNVDYSTIGAKDGSTVVNLFYINGSYIPASKFFKAIGLLIGEQKKTYVNANITFANTFPESNRGDDTYFLGYLDFIRDNNLTMVKNGHERGDPNKVAGFVMSNTSAGNFYMRWSNDTSKFWRLL